MTTFLKAYFEGMENMVKAKSDLDRLQSMPQKIVEGEFFNFKGDSIFTGINGVTNWEYKDAEKINSTKRCTSALVRDYMTAFNEVVANATLDNGFGEIKKDAPETEEDPLIENVLNAVADKDRKVVRILCKELEKKWFALDPDDVANAIDDIKDCISDGDDAEAEKIINQMEDDAIIGEEVMSIKEPVRQDKVEDNTKKGKTVVPAKESSYEPANEEEAELLADIEDAIKDKDAEDVELLIEKLNNEHPRYFEFTGVLAKLKGEDAPVATKEQVEVEGLSDEEIDGIIADIEDALKAKELEGKDGAKAILEELKEAVGEEDTDYVRLHALVYPPVESKRKPRRRGRK